VPQRCQTNLSHEGISTYFISDRREQVKQESQRQVRKAKGDGQETGPERGRNTTEKNSERSAERQTRVILHGGRKDGDVRKEGTHCVVAAKAGSSGYEPRDRTRTPTKLLGLFFCPQREVPLEERRDTTNRKSKSK